MPHRHDRFHQHIDYIKNYNLWVKISDLLTGDHDCLSHPDYLWLHSMEDPSRQCDQRDKDGALRDRKLREMRTRYVNYTRMVKERFVSLILRGGLNPSEEVLELLGDDINNIDGQDTSLEEFATRVAGDLVSYGACYIYTDTETKQARNILEEQEMGVRPYWIRIHPMSLEDWQIAADGEYEGFRHEYMLLKRRESLEEEPTLINYTSIAMLRDGQYTITTYAEKTEHKDGTWHYVNHHPDCRKVDYDSTSWVQEGDTTVVEGIDFIPLATSRVRESVLEPVVDIALKIYNKQSDLDNILHNQCYDRVFIFADLQGAISNDGKPLSDEAKEVKFATNSMVIGPENGQAVKLDPTDPKALMESIRDDIEDLFRVAFNKARTRKVDSRAPESEKNQKELKEDLLTRILRYREVLRNVLNAAIKDYARFKDTSNTDFAGEINYAQSITEADINELSSFVRAHTDRISQYEGVRKAVDKKLIAHLQLPKEEQLFQEIDDTELPDPDAAVNQVGNAGAQLRAMVTNNGGRQEKRSRNPETEK